MRRGPLGTLTADTPPDRAGRALCTLELARWRDAATAEVCEDAVAACRASEDPYRLAYALWRQAQARLVGSDHAADALRDAVAIAEALGAPPLLEAIRATARRARVTLPGARTDHDATPFGLTARELDVLRLVAAGRSNGQIGEALYISRKTASVHVSNILTKLSVSSRGEAAARAFQAGLEPLEDPTA